jgi:hypothetical protein
MAWITPKIDWVTDDAIGTVDLNRIEGNIKYLYDSVISIPSGLGAAIVVSNVTQEITITNKVHYINNSGATDRRIKNIVSSGFTPVAGDTLVLICGTVGGMGFQGTGGNVRTFASSAIDPSYQYSAATLVYDGTYWTVVSFTDTP